MRSFILALSFLFITNSILSQSISLRDQSNQYEFVIITLDQFEQTCQSFKDSKESNRNLKTLVTTKNQILAEFNDSSIVQNNIREFISYAGTNWSDPKPNYFMFAADVDSIPNFSFESVPGYEETDTAKSDYFYGINIFDEDTTQLSFSIGRISARTETELSNYFNKVIAYESDPTVYPWNNNALYLADDGKTPYGDDGQIFERIAFDLSRNVPDFINNKFIFESDSSEYFGTTDSIVNFINEIGTSAIFFSGHGNDSIFTHERYFTIDDVNRLNNIENPFFVSYMFKHTFSNDNHSSMMDQMLFSKGGAIIGVAPVGLAYAHLNSRINSSIWDGLYTNISIGDNFISTIIPTTINENRKYNIFGDPTFVLKYDPLASSEPLSGNLPSEYVLSQNYPNPFNPSTTIKYSIPNVVSSFNSSVNVKLIVYDILGREIAALVNKQQSVGNYEVIFNASNLPSGTYFYQLTAGTFIQTKKMLLIK